MGRQLPLPGPRGARARLSGMGTRGPHPLGRRRPGPPGTGCTPARSWWHVDRKLGALGWAVWGVCVFVNPVLGTPKTLSWNRVPRGQVPRTGQSILLC